MCVCVDIYIYIYSCWNLIFYLKENIQKISFKAFLKKCSVPSNFLPVVYIYRFNLVNGISTLDGLFNVES